MKKKIKAIGKHIAKKTLVCMLAASCIIAAVPMSRVKAFRFHYKAAPSVIEEQTAEEQIREELDWDDRYSETEHAESRESEAQTIETESFETEAVETEPPETEILETEQSETETSESETETIGTESAAEEFEEETELETEPPTEQSNQITSEDLVIKKDKGTFGILDGTYCFIVSLELSLKNSQKFDENITIPTLNYKVSQTLGNTTVPISADLIKFSKGEHYKTTIKVGFDHAGDYRILFTNETNETIGVVKYNIPLEKQILKLNEKILHLQYGEILYIDTLLKSGEHTGGQENGLLYPDNYEVVVEKGEEAVTSVLYEHLCKDGQEDEGHERDYIEAIGVNGAMAGEAVVSLRLKATPFKEQSNVEQLKLIIHKVETQMSVHTLETVKMYEPLPLEVQLNADDINLTEELLGKDGKASIDFYIYPSESKNNPDESGAYRDAVKVNSSQLVCKQGENNSCQYQIPVTQAYFSKFEAGETYIIHASFAYDEELPPDLYVPYDCNEAMKEITLLPREAKLDLSIDDETLLDYRTYFGGEKKPNLTIDIKDITEPYASDREIISEEKKKITYEIIDYDTDVIKVGNEVDDIYSPENNVIPIQVVGVGATTLRVRASGSGTYAVAPETVGIEVNNSTLYDEDFLITLIPKSTSEPLIFKNDEEGEGFQKWTTYLKEHSGWINGTVEIALSDTGARYFDSLAAKDAGSSKYHKIILNSSFKKQSYFFWAEHSKRNASTRAEKNGTREFTIGIDMEAPVLEKFAVDENYFRPTKTDTEQYYAQDFVLTGSFRDGISGVSKIEYTTDYSVVENEQKWQEAAITNEKEETTFCVTLRDGDYHAIAVRAYDHAGNVSQVKCLKNEKGQFIHIIVDGSVPVITVDASSGGKPYTGEEENWTNQGIDFSIAYDDTSSPYAGLYRCEYTYETIGEALWEGNRNQLDWNSISADSAGIADFSVGKNQAENKNGYYYFRAVSKSGLQSEAPIKKRILLQQSIAPKKEVIETGGGGSRKNEWYNKESGVPEISFAYPEYDDGAVSGAYEAPVTLHYNLTMKDENAAVTTLAKDMQATLGVVQSAHHKNGKFEVTSDELGSLTIDFGYNKETGYARDGIYTLEYWISDQAGNVSEQETQIYKVDCHEPTELTVKVADLQMAVDSEAVIRYQNFYQNAVSGSAAAQYGISGKDSIKIVKAKKIGDWKSGGGYENGDRFEIAACNRCFIYVVAEDVAGNKTEGWTRGIIVDNQTPEGKTTRELILEPEGANEQGFYNQDIEVRIAVKDTPDDDNCAALRSVTSAVGRDGGNTVTEMGLFEFITELPTEEQMTAAAGFETIQLIDAAANESNDAYIEVTAADRSDNVFVSTQVLKIDVTKPEIDISFDNGDAQNTSYFKADRIASVHVKELNFNPAAVELKVARNGTQYAMSLSDWTSDGIDHYANLVFQEDGDYTLSIKCTDLADNESEEVSVDAFTIDKTAPKLEVELTGGNAGALKEGYFNTRTTVAITVTEHNFRQEDFLLKSANHAKISAWSHKNDVHTAQITFDEDNHYSLDFEYVDLAGNSIQDFEPIEFTIDTTQPALEISGVTDGSANAGEVTPVITVYDPNFEAQGTAIEVTTGRGRNVQITKETAAAGGGAGFVYTLSDMTAKEDDIYYLTVTATDLAGNRNVQSIRFSLNRKGSTYDISGLSPIIEQYYNTYKDFSDIEVIEMNVDKVEDFNLYLSRNGQLVMDEVQYWVETSGSENLGYTFKYTIAKENFAKEGTYRLGFYSKDRAGNEVNNMLDVNGSDIQFVIDDTAPRVVIEGVETGKIYDVASRTIHVMVSDNFKLEQAQFCLVNNNGEELNRWDYGELVNEEGEIAAITIPEYDVELSLLFQARDAAGNEIAAVQGSKAALSGFMITTNKWIRLIHKPQKMQAAARHIAETFAVPEEAALAAVVLSTALLIVLAAAGIHMLITARAKNIKKHLGI